MAKRKETKTQHERKLVKQQVRRMVARGYRINQETLDKINKGNYQTLHSLRNNRYAKLYDNATAEIDTNIVTGKRYRQHERKVSAEKAVETRRINEEKRRVEQKAREAYEQGYRETVEEIQSREPEHDQTYYDDEDYESEWEEQHSNNLDKYDEAEVQSEVDSWAEQRAKQDEADLTLANAIDEGQVMYRNILDLMEKFPREGRNLLYRGLESEIRKYGLDMVMAGMAYAPMDVVQEAQNIIFYTGDKDSTHRALVNFFDSITGTIRTIQDSMGIGAVLDQMTDMNEL